MRPDYEVDEVAKEVFLAEVGLDEKHFLEIADTIVQYVANPSLRPSIALLQTAVARQRKVLELFFEAEQVILEGDDLHAKILLAVEKGDIPEDLLSQAELPLNDLEGESAVVALAATLGYLGRAQIKDAKPGIQDAIAQVTKVLAKTDRALVGAQRVWEEAVGKPDGGARKAKHFLEGGKLEKDVAVMAAWAFLRKHGIKPIYYYGAGILYYLGFEPMTARQLSEAGVLRFPDLAKGAEMGGMFPEQLREQHSIIERFRARHREVRGTLPYSAIMLAGELV